MPGLSGIVSRNASFNNPNQIAAQFEAVHSLNNVAFNHRSFQTDWCVITNTLPDLSNSILDQPISDPSGNTFLFLEGEIFNKEELIRYTEGNKNLSIGHILLELFLERDIEFVKLLNGEFNIVICQKSEQRLVIINDHLSSRPLYYMQEGASLIFGSEKKSVLAVTKETPTVNPVGLLQIFAHQHNVGGITFIKGLKTLPPATWLEFQNSCLKVDRYDTMTFHLSNSLPNDLSLIETWCDHLRQATLRRLADKERIIFSLSAGLDSRAVACAIPRDFRPIFARTRGFQDSLEVVYATEIAHRLQFDHFRESPFNVPLSEILPKVVWRTEGITAFVHCLTMSNHTFIKKQADFMIGGWLGDVSSGGHIAPFMLWPHQRHQFIQMVYHKYLHYSKHELKILFSEAFLDHNMPVLKDVFVSSFDPLDQETNIQLYELWDLYERQTHMTLSTALVDSYTFGHIRPFVDKTYLDFTLTLPTKLRFGQTLYKAMIYELGSEIQNIPNSNNNLKLRGTVLGNILNEGFDLGSKVKSKLIKKVKRSYKTNVQKAAADDIGQAVRRDPKLRAIIENFVDSSHFDSSIFNRAGILNMLNEHYQGTTNHSTLLCTLATFAVSLPYFVYNKPVSCPPEAEPFN